MVEELLALAARCEAASGPDTRLDECVVVALSGKDPMDFDGPWDAPAFTASIDDAMTLLPEGWCIASLEWWPMCGIKASITLREVRENDLGSGYDESCGSAKAWGRLPAIAITAAALRAKATPVIASMEGDNA